MRVLNLRVAGIALAAGITLGGCSTYGQFGNLGVGIGYGNRGYCDPYYDRYCAGYGYSPYGYSRYGYSPYGYSPYGYSRYGYSPYGWYDGFYYPGTGYYVYDSYRRPYVWTDSQRRYWSQRQRTYSKSAPTTRAIQENWGDFRRGQRIDSRGLRQERRLERSSQQSTARQLRVERQQARSEARQARSEAREQRRDDRGRSDERPE